MTDIKYRFPFRKRLLCFPEHPFSFWGALWSGHNSLNWEMASSSWSRATGLLSTTDKLSGLFVFRWSWQITGKSKEKNTSKFQLKIIGNALAELLNASLLFYLEENNSITEYFLLKQLEDFDKMEFNMEMYEVQECWMQRR